MICPRQTLAIFAVFSFLMAPACCTSTCPVRLNVTATRSIVDSEFIDCEALEDGGAIFMWEDFASLMVARCLFLECRSAGLGGALYIWACDTLLVSQTTGSACQATSGSFIFTEYSLIVETNDSSAFSCRATHSNVRLSCRHSPSNGRGAIHLLNSSWNEAMHRSGIFLDHHDGLSSRYCVFAHNKYGSCLFFENIGSNAFLCWIVVENACHSTDKTMGLLSILASIDMSDSVFQGNRFDYFLGCYQGIGYEGHIKFTRCIFDFAAFSTTLSIDFEAVDCSIGTAPSQLTECGKNPSAGPTGSSGDSHALAIGLGIGVPVALVIGVIIIAFYWAERHSRIPSYSPSGGARTDNNTTEPKKPHRALRHGDGTDRVH